MDKTETKGSDMAVKKTAKKAKALPGECFGNYAKRTKACGGCDLRGECKGKTKPKRKPPITFYVTRDPMPKGLKRFGGVALWAVIGKTKPKVAKHDYVKHPNFDFDDEVENVVIADTATFGCPDAKLVAKLLGLAKSQLDTGECRRVKMHVSKEKKCADQIPIWLDGDDCVLKAKKATRSTPDEDQEHGYTSNVNCCVASLSHNLDRINVRWFGKDWESATGLWWVALEMVK